MDRQSRYRAGSTEPSVTYLYHYPDDYSNFYITHVIFTSAIGKCFSACNAIDNHNRMRQSDIALDKYWVTQSGYFILATTVELGMGITDGKLIYCHGVSEGNVDRRISAL